MVRSGRGTCQGSSNVPWEAVYVCVCVCDCVCNILHSRSCSVVTMSISLQKQEYLGAIDLKIVSCILISLRWMSP